LLRLSTDDEVHRLEQMEKSVRRDAHKMKAFVRFREVMQNGVPHYIAWHNPDHFIVRKVAPFFSRRFKAMVWTILTKDESVSWDQQQLTYFPGVDRSAAPSMDELEDLWRTYYANIFNPARIKLKAMTAEMPVRHWATLPETEIIDQMLAAAPARVKQMLAHSEGYERSARDYFPDPAQPVSMERLAAAISGCRGCDLHCHATQPVFGVGPLDAKIVFVGEQPGDQEDLTGQPFVGPAGEVLDRALVEAGLDRASLYLTNTVKHFKFERHGKQRLHKRPNSREIRACMPWFEAEWGQLKAHTLVCLGATAASALIDPGFRLQQQRGKWTRSKYCQRTLATWHPASILRLRDAAQRQLRMHELVSDLRLIAQD
jgi:DNA polymerase